MKFYIQDSETSQFMRCDCTWSADIGEALDFLSERRAFFFAMKDVKKSLKILEVALEKSLPAFIPKLILSGSSQFPGRAMKPAAEQVPLIRGLQSSPLALHKKLPGLGEISRLNLL